MFFVLKLHKNFKKCLNSRCFMKKAFSSLGRTDIIVWCISVLLIVISYFLSPDGGLMNSITSLLGVTAIIFVARGQVLGQVLLASFAVLYGIVSYFQSYYGETAICIFLSLPLAAFAIVTWYKNPYEDSGEVSIRRLKGRDMLLLLPLTAIVTVLMYFLLSYIGTANIVWSSFSIATSFLAAGLTVLRSPYFALGYVFNDIVLIVLWITAALSDPSAVSMVFCFLGFLLNDSYSFVCWRIREKKQKTA